MTTHNNNDEGKARRGILFGGDALRQPEKSPSGPDPQPPLIGVLKVPGSESPNSDRAEIAPFPPKKPPDWVETENLHQRAPEGGGGFVYVMTNPDFPGSYKIGRTKMNVERRRSKLDTAVRKPFGVVMSLRVNDAKAAEKQLHNSLARKNYRENKRREYFNPPQEHLEEVLSKFAQKKLRLWNPPK